MSTLRDRVRTYLDDRRIDVKDLAKAAGISKASVYELLKHDKAGFTVTHKLEAVIAGHVHAPLAEPDPDALAVLAERVDSIAALINTRLTPFEMRFKGLVSQYHNVDQAQIKLQRDVRDRYMHTTDQYNDAYTWIASERRRLNRAMVVGTLMWLGLLAWVVL